MLLSESAEPAEAEFEDTPPAEQNPQPDIQAVVDEATTFASTLRVHPFKLTRPKVAIVGFTDHRKLALQLGDDFEVWGINELHRYEDVSRFHRWFEIHDRNDFEAHGEGKPGDPDHLKALARFDIPVYMHQHWDDIPASVPFPRANIEKALDSTYFTSSPAWEIAFALFLGAQEIHVYGVDMAQETEYAEQRPCCEYWIGVARGLGVKVVVPRTSDLLKSVGQYGFGHVGSEFALKVKERLEFLHAQDNEFLGQLRGLDQEMNNKSSMLEQQYTTQKSGLESEYRAKREQLITLRSQVFGAIQDCEFWRRSWAVPGVGVPGLPTPDRSKDARTGIVEVENKAA